MIDIFGNETIRALSLHQPFANQMLHGKIETRRWPTKYRGKVLICATLKMYNMAELFDISGSDQLERMRVYWKGEMLYGHAIAIGSLIDCRKMQPTDEDKCFVKYRPDLWCHVYANMQAVKPFPWKGSQGWRSLSAEEKQKIMLL